MRDPIRSLRKAVLVWTATHHEVVLTGHRATVIHINPKCVDISNREHFLQGPASVVLQSLLSKAFGDLLPRKSMTIRRIFGCACPQSGYGCREQTPAAPGYGPTGVHPQVFGPSWVCALRLRSMYMSQMDRSVSPLASSAASPTSI